MKIQRMEDLFCLEKEGEDFVEHGYLSSAPKKNMPD